MKKKLLLFITLATLCAQPLAAQIGYDYFDVNNIEALISPVASHFWDYNRSHFYVPKNDSTTSIYTSTIWIGGLDSANQLHLAAKSGGVGHPSNPLVIHYLPGPVGDSTSYSFPYNGSWDRVWKVNRADIKEWLMKPRKVSPPQSVLDWPAHGDDSQGQAANLAPFMDVDGDGQYDPVNDFDYPAIKGDQAVYFIFNDDARMPSHSPEEKLGIEIHGMAYGFDCPEDTALNHALFMEYTIFNRSNEDYHDVYIGSWTDFGLGNMQDDYVGSDPLRNLVFGYNGDNFDQDGGGITAYQNNLPAQGIRLLKGLNLPNDATDNMPSVNFGGNYNGFGMGDGIVDNEQLGMHCFWGQKDYAGPIGDLGNPQIAQDYYNLMQGNWKDGVPMTYGGNGYDPNNPLAIESRFMFPDSSDTVYIGTGGVATPFWDEVSAGNVPGDRRGVFSLGPINLDAGASNSFEIVYVFAQKMNDRLGAVLKMKDYSDHLQDLYNAGTTSCGDFDVNFGYLTGVDLQKINKLAVYPNPASNIIRLDNVPTNSTVEIFSMKGALVRRASINAQSQSIDVSKLNTGIYHIQVSNDKTVQSEKLIISR